jgi:hypothetical protein
MRKERWEELIIDYLSGELTNEDRVQFDALKEGQPGFLEMLNSYRDMYSEITGIPESEIKPEARIEFLSKFSENGQLPRNLETRSRRVIRRLSAAAAVILLMLTAAFFLGRQQGEIRALKSELQETKAAMDNLTSAQNTSTRIKGVQASYDLEVPDHEILEKIYTLLITDPSTQVRLTAIQALRMFADVSDAPRMLVDALSHQDEPIVQVALIDAIVQLQIGEATPEIEKLMHSRNLNEFVKSKGELALFKLRQS